MTDQPELEAKGIKESDYQFWRHHPVTKVFLAYLRDYRDDARQGALDMWTARKIDFATESELRSKIETLGEIADLEFAAISEFYVQVEIMNRQTGDEEDDDAGSRTT